MERFYLPIGAMAPNLTLGGGNPPTIAHLERVSEQCKAMPFSVQYIMDIETKRSTLESGSLYGQAAERVAAV